VSFEEWRPVVGYEGLYEVSSIGRVRSLDRTTSHGHRLTGFMRKLPVQLGRRSVKLSKGHGPRKISVHVLVAEAFHGPRPDGQEVRHLDGDSLNNCVDNLAWGTGSENTLDQVRHGRHHLARKTHCKNGHPLKPPNLVTSPTRIGQRLCRSCGNAASWGFKRGLHSSHPEVITEADRRYARHYSAHLTERPEVIPDDAA